MPAPRLRSRRTVAVLAAVLAVGACSVEPPPSAVPSPSAPAPAAASSPSASAAPRTVTVLGAGDVLIHPPVWEQARADAGGDGYDFRQIFAGVAETVSAADLALCHLETPVAGPGQQPQGYPRFSAPPQVLPALAATGFDGCSTASNHTIDQGVSGVVRTLDAMDAAGLGHAGSARTAAEARTPTIYDVAGVHVAHLSYTFGFNGLRRPGGREWIANLIEPERIRDAARAARAAGADIVVLSLHWGTEYRHTPDSAQVAWARRLAGYPEIDLILGHHAHVVQPIERVGDTWVVYGMGNEIARHADPIEANREGVMVQATFTQTGDGWRVTALTAVPTWTEISPRVRLVDLPTALAGDGLSADLRREYAATLKRVAGYLDSSGAVADGLVIAGM